jgi:nucleoside phosphorylase
VGKNNIEIVSVKIEVELETLDNIKSIFGNIDTGHSVQLCDGEVELELLTAGNTLSFDGGLTAELLLSFSVGVASGVVGNFIFASLCDRVKKLTLNGRRTRITEENITQVIETTINAVLASKEKESSIEKPYSEKLFLFVTANKNETAALLNCGDDFFKFRPNIQSTLPHDANFYNVGKFGCYDTVHLELIDQASARQGASVLSISNAIDAFSPDAVILVGVAFGSGDEKSEWQTIGDVIVSKTVTDYESGIIRKGDFLSDGVISEAGKFLISTFYSFSRTWIFNLNKRPAKCLMGNILSGDKFVDDHEFKCQLFKHYPLAYGGEMEGRGAYAACRDRGLNEWIIVKGICDWGDGNTSQNKQENQRVASKSAVSLLMHIFSNPNVFDKLPKNPNRLHKRQFYLE